MKGIIQLLGFSTRDLTSSPRPEVGWYCGDIEPEVETGFSARFSDVVESLLNRGWEIFAVEQNLNPDVIYSFWFRHNNI